MRFDDRLTTVLNQPSRTRHEKAVRWRQLVDLIARAGLSGPSAILDQAIETVRAEAELVEEHLRAAAARSVAALPLPTALIEIFASDTLAVSAPVLAAASLSEKNWGTVMEAANPETRAFIAALHPGARTAEAEQSGTLILSDPVTANEPKPELPEPTPKAESTLGPVPIPAQSKTSVAKAAASVADVVARIERRKRPRIGVAKRPADEALKDSGQFNWECGPGGDIEWVEGIARGAVIGSSIAVRRSFSNGGPDEILVRAFARRSPFRDARFVISGGGVAAGDWLMSGIPAFDSNDGRFAGYRGVALRDRVAKDTSPSAQTFPASMTDPASLRELVHEIKTPLNAIIGFAEIIDGQYLGPADRPYRQRAAHIVSQARLLLGAIDDLDFAAKAHAQAAPASVNLTALMEEMIYDLRARARQAGAEIDVSRLLKTAEAAISPSIAERAIRSTFMAVIDQAGRGERLRLSVDEVGNRPRVAISRPRALEGMSEPQLFGITGPGDESGPGIGFSLRLARGLARIAGIGLNAGDRDIALLFDSA